MSAFPPIGDYALIGDCRSAALVSSRGSLDWLCWPRFDSPSMFAAILDREAGGRWELTPVGPATATRRYLPATNVLETRYETPAGGVAIVTDFMPVSTEDHKRAHLAPDHEVVRLVRALAGTVTLRSWFQPRPDYAREQPTLRQRGKLGIRAETRGDLLSLHGTVAHDLDDDRHAARATFALGAGERAAFSLVYATEAPAVLPDLGKADDALARTVAWWETWSARCTYRGPYADAVLRSVLTLKLLEYPTTGAFVAAPTTSLPERLGSSLNWDYRYCWLRDASLTTEALWETGYHEEAEAFLGWMLHTTRLSRPRLHVMYDLYGNAAATERTLDHLTGYGGARPVNIGNGAKEQSQLDTYGEVICSAAKIFRATRRVDHMTAARLVDFGHFVIAHWREPDAGIWEPRGEPVAHTHSRLLCWVAIHELIGLHEQRLIEIRDLAGFHRTRDEIRAAIEAESWNAELGSYTAVPGTTTLDATLLLMTWHGFEEVTSARARQTSARVIAGLRAGDALLYRYLRAEGDEEGAFAVCAFWAVEYLAMGGGSLADATAMFERLLAYGNDVGLFAEEIDPATGAALGNFPQGFTHIGVVNAALAIESRRQRDAA